MGEFLRGLWCVIAHRRWHYWLHPEMMGCRLCAWVYEQERKEPCKACGRKSEE